MISPGYLLLLLLSLAMIGQMAGYQRALGIASSQGGIKNLGSLPVYYGAWVRLSIAIPGLILLGLWLMSEDAVILASLREILPPDILALDDQRIELELSRVVSAAAGVQTLGQDDVLYPLVAELQRLQQASGTRLLIALVATASVGFALSYSQIRMEFVARRAVERIWMGVLFACAGVAVVTTLGILLSVVFEAIRFFQLVSVGEFLFGTEWSPQIAMRADQQGSSGRFGVLPLITGTMLVSLIALAVAVPVGLMSAIYLSEYAERRWRDRLKPALEVLAGIPTVVYGVFAALTVAPIIRDLGSSLGLSVSSESALAAGLVMGIMIIPFVSSLADDIIHAVPQSMRDGSLALGATESETITRVVIPAALPGIVGGILLAASRAIGETMIVVMAAGLSANLTLNPLESVTTVTVQIVTLLVGDQEFDSPKTLAAFALGLMLFIVTLALNFYALYIVRKYREQYD